MKKDLKEPITVEESPVMLKKRLDIIDPRLSNVFLPWAREHPKYLQSFIHLARAYGKTERSRAKEMANGLRVPPFLILSITSRCNLNCAGCFAAATGTIDQEIEEAETKVGSSLNLEEWRAILTEASELGVFCFVIAGGEPFLFSGLLDLCEEFDDRLFLILTNGTALTEADYERLKRLGNIMIIVSIEGERELTDSRRGEGIYEKAMKTLKELDDIGVLTGISVTINRMNFKHWMDPKNIDFFIEEGVRLMALIEYIPLTPVLDCGPGPIDDTSGWDVINDHTLMLTPEERRRFRSQIIDYRRTKPIYLIHSPGDEEFFGGCVSAGRGFAHITPSGDLTPCPVSNIATHNLKIDKLRDGLASPLFKKICENEHLLETDGMPCALFAHPKEVEALAKSVGAYRTDIRKR
ncbi:MAG: radical SAM protein [Halobacteriota archaeon]|nr:radical SAM protein [Halobacteriota archaeon]